MIDIVRRTALTASFALTCALFPTQAARAEGAAAVTPYDANEAQLSGGPQAYDDIYQSQTAGIMQPGTTPGTPAGRAATPEQHMLAAPGMPQAGGGIAAPAPRKAKAAPGDPYALGGGAGPQPYGPGAGTHPVYKLPY